MPGPDIRCGQDPQRHDGRYIWVQPESTAITAITQYIVRHVGSVEMLARQLSEKLPPCNMDGLPVAFDTKSGNG